MPGFILRGMTGRKSARIQPFHHLAEFQSTPNVVKRIYKIFWQHTRRQKNGIMEVGQTLHRMYLFIDNPFKRRRYLDFFFTILHPQNAE